MSAVVLPLAHTSAKAADSFSAPIPNLGHTQGKTADNGDQNGDCKCAPTAAAPAGAPAALPAMSAAETQTCTTSTHQRGVAKQKRRAGGSAVVETPSGVQTSLVSAVAPEKYLNQHQVLQLRKKTRAKAKEFSDKMDLYSKRISVKIAAHRKESDSEIQRFRARLAECGERADMANVRRRLFQEHEDASRRLLTLFGHVSTQVDNFTTRSPKIDIQLEALNQRLDFFDLQCAASDHEVGDFIMQFETARADLAEYTANFATYIDAIQQVRWH